MSGPLSQDTRKKLGRLYAQAWLDDGFRAKISDDPHAALASVGIDVPEGRKVVVHHDTADTMHLVVPSRPAHLSDDQLSDEGLHADFTKVVC